MRRALLEVLVWSPLCGLMIAGMHREPAVAAFGVALLVVVAFCVGLASIDGRRR
jgi:hypothetical protein